VEIVLGALLIGGILESQASWEDFVSPVGGTAYNAGAPAYLTLWAWGAGLLLAAALGYALYGVLAGPARRLAVMRSSQLSVAVAAILLVTGYLLAGQVTQWTAGCPAVCPSPGPTANTVASSIALDLGAGLAAALLPGTLWIWCRSRREEAAAPPSA
jgi:hypothetical protein